jgi:hypothetical protein
MSEEATIVSRSQVAQDAFVVCCLNGMRSGRFLDIGAGEPELISNTVMLERDFGWSGICCDIETEERLREQRSAVVVGDFFSEDWGTRCDSIAVDGRIDYLSLDLEPPQLTLAALCELPLAKVRFSVITIEHDAYRGFDSIRTAMRAILLDHGYVRVASDVKVQGLPFEDWWVDPKVIDVEAATQAAKDVTEATNHSTEA